MAFLLLWTFTAVVLCLSLSLLSVSTCSMVEGAVPVMYVFVRWATAYFRNGTELARRAVCASGPQRHEPDPTPRPGSRSGHRPMTYTHTHHPAAKDSLRRVPGAKMEGGAEPGTHFKMPVCHPDPARARRAQSRTPRIPVSLRHPWAGPSVPARHDDPAVAHQRRQNRPSLGTYLPNAYP